MKPAESRDIQSIRDLLQSSSHRDLATFVLSALLQSNYQAPVYLFVPPETLTGVAAVVASSIPRIHGQGLTIVMRDADVLRSDARITGFWSDSYGADLPDACYESPNAGYHSVFSRKSDHVQTLPYAEFAVAQLAEGRSLASFLKLCEQCRVKSAEELQDLFALELAPARLEFDRLLRLIDNPATLPRLRQSPAARQRCVDWVRSDLAKFAAELGGVLDRAGRVGLEKGELLSALDRLLEALRRH